MPWLHAVRAYACGWPRGTGDEAACCQQRRRVRVNTQPFVALDCEHGSPSYSKRNKPAEVAFQAVPSDSYAWVDPHQPQHCQIAAINFRAPREARPPRHILTKHAPKDSRAAEGLLKDLGGSNQADLASSAADPGVLLVYSGEARAAPCSRALC